MHPLTLAPPDVQPAAGNDQTGQTFSASSSVVQPSDAAASGFYISNPNNRVTSNAASGGYSGGCEPGGGWLLAQHVARSSSA